MHGVGRQSLTQEDCLQTQGNSERLAQMDSPIAELLAELLAELDMTGGVPTCCVCVVNSRKGLWAMLTAPPETMVMFTSSTWTGIHSCSHSRAVCVWKHKCLTQQISVCDHHPFVSADLHKGKDAGPGDVGRTIRMLTETKSSEIPWLTRSQTRWSTTFKGTSHIIKFLCTPDIHHFFTYNTFFPFFSIHNTSINFLMHISHLASQTTADFHDQIKSSSKTFSEQIRHTNTCSFTHTPRAISGRRYTCQFQSRPSHIYQPSEQHTRHTPFKSTCMQAKWAALTLLAGCPGRDEEGAMGGH